MQLSAAGARVPSIGMTPHGRDGANVQTRGKYSKVCKAQYVTNRTPYDCSTDNRVLEWEYRDLLHRY
jgi:hypothetical protein